MSYNRLIYDPCSFNQRFQESVKPLAYQTQTPRINKSYNPNPGFLSHLEDRGVSCNRIDAESDILNITRPASKCPSRKFPVHSQRTMNNIHPESDERLQTKYTKEKRACNVLSGININRFEPLCTDLQNPKLIHNNCYIGLNTRTHERDNQPKYKNFKPIFGEPAGCCEISEQKGYRFKCKFIKDSDKVLPTNIPLKGIKQAQHRRNLAPCNITLE